MTPIDDWRQAWRLWSVRVCAAAATIYTTLVVFAEQAHAVWEQLPPEVQAVIPGRDKIAIVLFVAAGIARVLRQPGQLPAAPPSLSLQYDESDVVLAGSGQVDGSLTVDKEPRP